MNARMHAATVHPPRPFCAHKTLGIRPSDSDGRSVECDSHPRHVRRRGRQSERHYLLPGAGLSLHFGLLLVAHVLRRVRTHNVFKHADAARSVRWRTSRHLGRRLDVNLSLTGNNDRRQSIVLARGVCVSDQANLSSFVHRQGSSNERPKDHGFKSLKDARLLCPS
jgi:hypothetical protein